MDVDSWSDENLEKMRMLGDEDADKLVDVILTPITPEEVERRLNALLADLGPRSTDKSVPDTRNRFEGPGADRQSILADIRSVRTTLVENAEYHAGTFRVLDCMKVAGAALHAAEVACQYEDLASASRFRDQAITAIENSKQDLNFARKQQAKGSSTSWFTPEFKRAAYNNLVQIAQYLATAPDLLSAPESAAAQQFDAYPGGLKEYFAPTPAPGWVNEELLAHASRVWEQNNLFILLVLFAGSLPYCYLDRQGIPLLYETGKLTDKEYISQRLYETGLMLSAVMSRGGIRVDHDIARVHQQVGDAAKNPAVTEIYVRHTPDRHEKWSLQRDPSTAAAGTESGIRGGECNRYLTGEGVLYAKKVRVLHAAMRHMALLENKSGSSQELGRLSKLSQAHWNMENGVPINQEDLAFTLLTFGYVIPKGLGAWGRRPNNKETRAFLHCWKVTGYLMGVREDLLTDDPDAAEQLFNILLERLSNRAAVRSQPAANPGGASTSVSLTWAIADFLNRYLPRPLHGLPAVMIENQVGRKNAKTLLATEQRWRPLTRVFFWTVVAMSKIHGLMTRFVYTHIPLVDAFFNGLMQRVGMAFIESWKDPFERKPFTLPEELQGWTLKKGVTEDYLRRIQQWRQRIFTLLALGLILLVGGSVAICIGIILSLINPGLANAEVGLLIGVPLFVLASLFMQKIVDRTAKRRPAMLSKITLVRKSAQG